MIDDILTYPGGAVKAIGEGKVGGYLIMFGRQHTDLEGDYFTPKTKLWIKTGDRRPILFDHGRHPHLGLHELGEFTARLDNEGLWIDGRLDLTDPEVMPIWSGVKSNRFGWSSGSLPHMVEPKTRGGEVTSWPVGEGSITATPAQPKQRVIALKSLPPTLLYSEFDNTPPEVQAIYLETKARELTLNLESLLGENNINLQPIEVQRIYWETRAIDENLRHEWEIRFLKGLV